MPFGSVHGGWKASISVLVSQVAYSCPKCSFSDISANLSNLRFL